MPRIKQNQIKWLLLIIPASLLPKPMNCLAQTATKPSPAKPNIIYVFADQWRAQATGYNGDPNLIGKTPNLDRIASHSVNFTNAISVCPFCTPYRASLLTGQYPTSTGMIFNDVQLPVASLTMAKIFKASGYQTAYIGKWHLDGMGRFEFTPPARRQGFDYWKALECSHEYNNLLYYTGNTDEKHYWEGYGPYAETKDAIQYINLHAKGKTPFLLVLSWGAPHFPHVSAPKELQQQFTPEKMILAPNVAKEMMERARQESVGYYGHILALDKCLGDIQNAISEAGIADNTIFVFTSDHGEMMGAQGVAPRQKQVPYAESVRVPFLLRYPAQYGNRAIVVNAPIDSPDILPTLLSLAGIPVPETVEGEDMTPAIGHPDAKKDKAALIMNPAPSVGNLDEYRGIYTDRYAYVKNLNGPWFLYDHATDPFQLNNLAGMPAYSELQNRLEGMLQQELRKIGDDFRPRTWYFQKWGYQTSKEGNIEVLDRTIYQGPALNKK
jgi:arylsulfatase A-like enzyme